MPANAAFLRYYADGGGRYLARSWLLDESRTAPASAGKAAPLEPWNRRDWYFSFGDDGARTCFYAHTVTKTMNPIRL